MSRMESRAHGGCRKMGMAGMLILLVGITLTSADASAEASAAQPPAFDPPLHDPWTRGDTRVLRQWLLLGPLPGPLGVDQLAADGGEASVHPGETQPGGTKRWAKQPWGEEPLELTNRLDSAEYRGSKAAPEVAYAFRIITRDKDGDALLSLGRESGVRIWVNGALVYSQTASTGFAFDTDRIPVHFNSGENRLLLKFEHRSGPWRFALRVLEPGAVVSPENEIIPHVNVRRPGALEVVAQSAHPSQAARDRQVKVQVTAAGARMVAQAVTARDRALELPTTTWPDGAYEIHLTTQNAWGRPEVLHVPWYKGDAPAAARKLLAAAQSAPAGIRGDTARMLANLVRDRAKGDLGQMADDAWPLLHAPLLEYEELQQGNVPGRGPVHAGGFVRLAYNDESDGTTQFCRAYLPLHYSTTARWPVVIELHGYNPLNPAYVGWWSVDKRHDPHADRYDVIYIEPHGRGNAQYMGIGEQDVLRCLQEAKRRLSVDEDRVYLMGFSMGGHGTWFIASRHPELFAAAAPVYGGWDFRVIHDPHFENPRATSLPELFAAQAQSSFREAESLLNLPLYVQHGDEDQAVNVEFSRHAVRMLQRWGYDVRYREFPGRGHEELNNRDKLVEWLLTHRRVSAPAHVRVRATDLDGAAAYWVRVLRWQAPLAVIRADAEVIEPGVIRLDTDNVASVRLSPPSELRHANQPLRVVWNGTERMVPFAPDGGVTLSEDGTTHDPGALDKHPGLSGGLSDLIRTPFAIVVGTASSDPVMQRLCRQKAETFARLWGIWQHQTPRVFTDDQLTPDDAARYSLLLIGGSDANRVTRRLQPELPLAVDSRAITVGGRKFETSDAVVQMIYPSPLNPSRYVLVVAATSSAGMYFWQPGGLWSFPYGQPALAADWTIQDGRLVTLPAVGPYRAWVASGSFDRYWRADDRWVFPGDPELRDKSRIRHAPPADFTVPQKVLESYVGQYELAPGRVVSISRDGDRLLAKADMTVVLTPESNEDFVSDEVGGVVTFQHDAKGSVTGLQVIGDQSFEARRIPPAPQPAR